MIKGYFGTPGVGKTTTLVKIARKEQRRIIKRYKNIYTVNVDIKGCTRITKEDFEKYKFENALILWDEITLDYDNRDFKNFSKKAKESWLLHRHMGLDIIYVTQNFENVDKKIRDITDTVYLVERSRIPFHSVVKKIYHNFSFANRQITDTYDIAPRLEWQYINLRKYFKYYFAFFGMRRASYWQLPEKPL